jgi:putative ABC transport system permease protein
MIKNFFLVAYRNLVKSKLYSFINIAGLSVGIAACILIFLYVQYELSYDKYNVKAGRIYRLTEMLHLPKEDRPQAVTSPIMTPTLQANFPEIQKSVRITFSSRVLSVKERKFYDTKIVYADSTLFDIFTFPMLHGDPHTALTRPYSIVLTEAAAKKYFGDDPALGKVMQFSDTINLTVTGVIKDIPVNSHFNFDCALSRITISDMNKYEPETNWFNNSQYSYLLLPEKNNYRELEGKINVFMHKQMAEEKKTSGLWYDLKLQPVTDIHLKSNMNAEINPNSNTSYVYIFSAAAILILLIACCNFINLSTARSLNRSKEIGLRKVVGAMRKQLIAQFLSESFLCSLIAGVIAFGLVRLSLPWFNNFTGKNLPLNFFQVPGLALVYSLIIIGVGLIAGSYPALLMSSFTPITALKGVIRHGWQDIVLRKGLVVFQFTIAIILIVGTGLVLKQLKFIQNRKIGLNKDQVVEIGLRRADLPKGDVLIKEINKNSGVINSTLTDFSFKSGISNIAILPQGAAENEITSQPVISIDENFLKTFQIQLAAGREFSNSHFTDSTGDFMVNETAVKVFGWKTPQEAIGKDMDWGLGKKGKVIGVVKDFNFASLHDNIQPLIIHIKPDWYRFVAIRVKPEDLPKTLENLESTWKGIATGSPFEYTFLDEDFGKLYKEEQNLQSVLTLFTLLSIAIACLGLFGLAAFTIKQRFKEIAVRKVLGASVTGIIGLLSKDFLLLVIISALIAFPLAWWGMHKWLQDFAYRINIGWWTFLVAAIAALLIALITISFQAIKAAITNPVKSLRTE